MELREALRQMPLIAVLSNISSAEILPIAQALVNTGITCLAVSINSGAEALASIQLLTEYFGNKILLGMDGAVTTEQLQGVAQCKAQFIMTYHTNPALIQIAKELNLYCIPGFSSPTEAFSAIAADADALQIYPCPPPFTIKALKAVLPVETLLIAGKGSNSEAIPLYFQAGVNAFVVEQELEVEGDTLETITYKTRALAAIIRSL